MTVADSMSAQAICVFKKKKCVGELSMTVNRFMHTVLHSELASSERLKPKDCLFFMVNDANFACFHNSGIITTILLPCLSQHLLLSRHQSAILVFLALIISSLP